jgi:hypothetical protein
MANDFKKIVGLEDPNLQSVQDNVRDVLQPFVTNPTLDGVLLEGISINPGSNLVEHKLAREYRGFYLVSTGTAQTAPLGWTNFTPTIAVTGGGGITLTSNDWCYYKVEGNVCHIEVRIGFTISTATSPYVTIAAPIQMKSTSVLTPPYGYALTSNGAATLAGTYGIQYSDNLFYCTTDAAGTAWAIGAGRLITFVTSYQVDDSVTRGTKIVEMPSPDRTKFLKVEADGKMNAKIYVF